MPKTAKRDTAPVQPEPQVVEIPLHDDPYSPVIYSTELAGGGQQGENFQLTFAVMLYDHGKGATRAYRKTNLRLVMPIAAVPTAINFLQQLNDAHKHQTEAPPKDRRLQ